MTILADLTVLELPATGVARVLTGLYGALGAGFPQIALRGVHRRALATEPPAALRAVRLLRALPAGAWRRAAIPLEARRQGGAVIHFPWNGEIPRGLGSRTIVTTMHDVLPLTIPDYFRSEAERDAYRMHRARDAERSTIIVTDSEFSRTEIIRHLSPRCRVEVIYCATSLGEDAPPPAAPGREHFLYVGGLDPRKSLDALLRVFVEEHAAGRLHARLIVTGSDRHAPPALRALLREGVDRGSVEFRGYVEERELARLYRGAIALVYPSRYEGFGMPPLEAMTLGCPVITVRASSIPEVCAGAVCYVDPWSERGLAEAMRSVETESAFAARLAGEGRRRASEFSWARAAARFVQLVDEVRS